MPLVVPALQLFVVFLNVYETFKTLKPPPPSARRGGQPSVRAITQRKRDLKGCLAVWVVWCCYAVYERTFDRIVGIFLPFYSEIKSVFLLFLVLTRAKGAEPLFLHVLRPLVRPYAAVVDPMLELSRDIGDFCFALLQVPLDYISSSPWFLSWCIAKSAEEPGESLSDSRISSANSEGSTRTNNSSIPILANHNDVVQPFRGLDRYGSIRSVSDNQRLNGRPSVYATDRRASQSSTTSLPAYSEHPPQDPPRYSQTLPRRNGHQTWHSHASVSSNEAPMATFDVLGTAPEYHSPEWRTYPAFPSAYPPTPLPPSASLPSSVTPRPDHRLVSDPAYPPIPEDEQGFGETLERVHGGYSGSVHSSSNSNKLPTGVQNYEESSDVARQDTGVDESMYSSEAGLSEDEFGTSLRTPHRRPQAMLSGGYSSVDSLTSASTTTDNAPSLRTKTSSDSFSSGSSSLAGRKRSYGASKGNAQNTIPLPHSRNATLRGKPVPSHILQDPPQLSTSESEDVGGDGSTVAKRRRVLNPLKRKSTVRPAARGLGNTRKPILSRSATLHNRTVTASQGTARTRAGSATTINSTIRERKSTHTLCQVMRGGPQGVIKSSSTCSSQSGTLKGRAY